ncbi:glycosyltransferase [Kocuria turfanensis]|uniref:glycosyltransferase n=1 Tax=Kocuria turfanensis TaxID=388357 RepID=UPI004035334B
MVMDNTRKKLWHLRHSEASAGTHSSAAEEGAESNEPHTGVNPSQTALIFEQGRVVGQLGAELDAVRRDVDAVRVAAQEAREYAESKAGSHFSLWKKVSARTGSAEKKLDDLETQVGGLRSGIAALESRVSHSVRTSDTVLQQVQALEERWHAETVARLAAVLPLMPADSDYSTLLGSVPLKEVLAQIEDPLFVFELAEKHDAYRFLNLTKLRGLSRDLYRAGYLERSHRVMRRVAGSSQKPNDQLVLDVRTSELDVMSGSFLPAVPSVESDAFVARPGRVLHVVGKAIPETQTGYTLRTHYLAQALYSEGFEVGIFRQVGGVRETYDQEFVRLDDIDYFLPRGEVRGDVPWTTWLDANVAALADVVAQYRPSGLHAHSDFLNFLIADAVGKAYGIPVVYESRGFWEESWLSRAEDTQGRSLQPQIARYGSPESYSWRREREDDARRDAAVVTTLARVMREHIAERGLDAEGVFVTPNGVDPDDFPVVDVDEELKQELGLDPSITVIGYITSVVEYEGIDVLLEAFESLAKHRSDIHCLIVGDGLVKRRLEKYAQELGIDDRVLFTGRVPHQDVLRYYSLIDIFVVPRRPTTVCHLVTPLKPFEAFSTGRTVVMSDVRALKEIADDSEAALTFEAGNSMELAKVLERLLADEPLRRQLAASGAEWVRAQRSWRSIAERYEAPYESVGIGLNTPVSTLDPIANGEVDVQETRRRLTVSVRSDAVRFLQVHGDESIPTSPEAATDVMATGWAAYGFPAVDLSLPLSWRDTGIDDRSWRMHFHCWEFMHPVLHTWAATGEAKYLRWCVDRALSWTQEFPDLDDPSMAWYDMSVAYRSIVLLSIIRASAASSTVTDDEFAGLLRLALRHRDAHWREESFNVRNNHGYYAAVSQLVLAGELDVLPGMRPLEQQGKKRLRLMTSTQFLPDGGHSEHSPDYHRMLLSAFEGAIGCGAVDDPEIEKTIALAAEALGWMIQPSGNLIQFGDSAERNMVREDASSISPTTEWILSGGTRGRPANEELKVLPQTGYVFVRSPLAGEATELANTSYLAFMSAFHSRAHKHSDDQTMIWHDKHHEILVDGGRYRYGELLDTDSPLRAQGFYYADPMRQHMESCRAHSTVSLDGDIHDRRRTPFGSGIQQAFQAEDGRFVIVSSAPHGHWTHDRKVQFRPGAELVVDDVVRVHDGKKHRAYTWFLLDGNLDLNVQDDGELHLTSPMWEETLVVTHSLPDTKPSIRRAEEDPISGFRSRKDRTKEPAWSVCWEHDVQGELSTATRFAFRSTPGDASVPEGTHSSQ